MDKEFRLKDGLHVAGNAAVVGSITTVDSIQFNLTHNVTNEVGMLDWSVDDNTVELGLTPNVTLQVGQEQLYLVKNQTGSTINNGTVVMAAGTLGASGRILVTPAISDGTYPSQYIMGLATEDIINGSDGFVSGFGKVRGLDTSMFSNGDILYADPEVPGGLSNVAPIAPNNKVTVALVINSDINNGVLFVRPTFGSSIEDDENVYLSNLVNGQVLAWSSANARFENLTLTSNGGSGDLSSAFANDYNTYTTLSANDGATLATARGNDHSTLLTARANDFTTFSTLSANDGATLATARGNDHSTLLTARSNDFVTWSGLNNYINLKANASSPTLSNTVTFTNAITENVHTLSGTTNVQLNAANGTIQVHTLTAATSYTDGLSSGQYITLMIDDGAARLVTWPSITWVNNRGLAPTLATTGFTVISLWKVSSTLYGALVGDGT